MSRRKKFTLQFTLIEIYVGFSNKASLGMIPGALLYNGTSNNDLCFLPQAMSRTGLRVQSEQPHFITTT